ncbi:ubiquitin-like domain-containing protein CIP73 isoform X2 [Vitis riparia]|uniref:ubiquitin-like domain-containing protein CIP73 isoform X2 n=1 Tax=Vitis riparia TaxID=96939 RepID=UPI00155AA68B|nr:ubiquitin-like domain-containing protein CIP73 isoform X2 [Vitis riparia]
MSDLWGCFSYSMADQYSCEGSSLSPVSGDCSESTVELNVKTLDSRIHSFHVDKNLPVSLFKEKIANEIGVPVEQQRLIFRGKVLKDDQLLAEYHVENGHTLHLVARDPTQSQPSSGQSSGETNGNNGSRGNDANAGGPRARVGQISHSVVLGTFNVGEQAEGIVPDLTRVIGAVLNSFGIGSQTTNTATGGAQPNTQSNAPGQASQGIEVDGTHGNANDQRQEGNQAQPSQPFQSLPQVMQFPVPGGAGPAPQIQPIPDSLHTLSEFMNRMGLSLSHNVYQPNSSPTNADIPRVELPSNSRGLPTPEALSIVMRQAERLLSGNAVAALSHIAGRVEQEGASTDPTIRGEIQTEALQVGLAMQHLGVLLLELGRTILTLRMGQSPDESSVNAGPAVYISPSGPNPIMVQPFPLQTSSFFGGSTVPQSNPPAGPGNAPRHINIHIHAGTSLPPIVSAAGTRAGNGDGMQGERANGNVSAQSGASISQAPSDSGALSSVIAEVNSRIRNLVDNMRGGNQVPSGQAGSSTVQNMSTGSGPGNDVGSDQLKNMAVAGAGETSLPSDTCIPGTDGHTSQPEHHQMNNNQDKRGVSQSKDVPSTCAVEGSFSCSSGSDEATSGPADASDDAPRSSQRQDIPEEAKAVPLGLGMGGLQLKKRSKQPKSQGKNNDCGTSSVPSVNQNQGTMTSAQQVLQSLASRGSTANRTDANCPPSQFLSSRSFTANRMDVNRPPSHFLASRSFTANRMDASGPPSGQPLHVLGQVREGMSSGGQGLAEQSGAGSPDVLSNMLQQLSQNPLMMNTVNQIAQQVDGQELESMFSGLGRGQGGGIDLSRMVQQMMPIVSRALSSGPNRGELFHGVGSEPQPQHSERRPSRGDKPDVQNSQTDLREVAESIERQIPPQDIFRSVAENAVQLYANGTGPEGLLDVLCSDEHLATEFMEVLQRDVCNRLHGKSGAKD